MYEMIPFGGDSIFNYLDNWWGSSSKSVGSFKADVIDKGDQYLLQAELPGFNKEDIYIDLDGNYLTINASHSESTSKSTPEKVVRRERHYSSFSRSFNVSGINTDEITAEYANGILELHLPKVEEEKPKTKKIEIN